MVRLNVIDSQSIQKGNYSSIYFPDDYNNPSKDVADNIVNLLNVLLNNEDKKFVEASDDYNRIIDLINQLRISSNSLEIGITKNQILKTIQCLFLKMDSLYTFDAINREKEIRDSLKNGVIIFNKDMSDKYLELLTKLIQNYYSFRLARYKRFLNEATGLTISSLEEYKKPSNLGFIALEDSNDVDERFFDVVYYLLHSMKSNIYSVENYNNTEKYVQVQIEMMNIFESILLNDEIVPEIKYKISSLYKDESYDEVGSRYFTVIQRLKQLSSITCENCLTLVKKDQN